jgi:RNA polymerase sigma factor (sigma-70 family)
MHQTQAEASRTDEELAGVVALRDRSDREWQEARRACGDLYVRHAPRLLAFLAPRVRPSDLEDIHQAIWQRVWERLPRRFDGTNFRAWLYRIARNLAIDQSRRNKRLPVSRDNDWSPSHHVEVWEALVEQERMSVLGRCIQQLAPELLVLVRARLSGDAYAEISKRLGCAPERAHKLFHQAKEQLQDCVQRALK